MSLGLSNRSVQQHTSSPEIAKERGRPVQPGYHTPAQSRLSTNWVDTNFFPQDQRDAFALFVSRATAIRRRRGHCGNSEMLFDRAIGRAGNQRLVSMTSGTEIFCMTADTAPSSVSNVPSYFSSASKDSNWCRRRRIKPAQPVELTIAKRVTRRRR